MSAFDATLTVGGLDVAVPNEDAIQNGIKPHVQVVLEVVQPLPLAQGPGQPPVLAHFGTIKFHLGRDQAVEFFKLGLETAEKLPQESQLEIATDLSAAEQAAEALKRMQG